jgi:hypothetical protein
MNCPKCPKNCSLLKQIDCQTAGGCRLGVVPNSRLEGLKAISTIGRVLTPEEIYGESIPYIKDILDKI